MKTAMIVTLLFGNLLAAQAPAPTKAGGPSPEVPELANFSAFVGQWDCQYELKPVPGISEGGVRKGTASGEWILEGRFLRQEWTVEAKGAEPSMSGSTLMTYDPMKQSYRIWGFNSTSAGSTTGEGTFDVTTKTLNWTSRDENGVTTTTKSSFDQDGAENWSIVVKGGDGQVYADLTGKNTRRAK